MDAVLTAYVCENGFLLQEEAEPGVISRRWIASTQEQLSKVVFEILEARKAAKESRGVDSIR